MATVASNRQPIDVTAARVAAWPGATFNLDYASLGYQVDPAAVLVRPPADDTRACFDAQREYDELTRKSQEDATETAAVLAQAKSLLEAAREKMNLTYANLKATGLPEKYGVRGFPTLIIIDQEGKVRDVHVGYAPDLAKNVWQTVDELLAGS